MLKKATAALFRAVSPAVVGRHNILQGRREVDRRSGGPGRAMRRSAAAEKCLRLAARQADGWMMDRLAVDVECAVYVDHVL